MIFSRAAAIGLSIALRAVLLLVVASLVYEAAPAEEATAFFQILFLQGIIVAFLSAAGFFRVQDISDEAVVDYFAAALMLVPLSLVLPVGLIIFDPEYQVYWIAIVVLWTGGVATALAAPLSGLILRENGPFAAFLPSCIGTVLGAGCLGFWLMVGANWHPILPYLVLAGFQCVTFALLAVQAKGVLRAAILRLRTDRLMHVWTHATSTFGIGLANVMHMVAVLTLREFWADRADAEIAAAVFLILRFSEAAFQFVHMVLSGQSLARRLVEARQAHLAQFGMFAAAIGALMAINSYSSAVAPLLLAVMMQLMADAARVLWSLSFLWQMSGFRLRRYLAFTLIPPAIGGFGAYMALVAGQPMAPILMLLIITWSGAAISSFQARNSRSSD